MTSNSRNYIWNHKNEVGSGKTAVVYKGWHLETGECVACKVIKPTSTVSHVLSEEHLSTWSSEIEAFRGLNHKNIVQYFGIEMVEESTGELCFVGQPVLLFEYCHGTSLEELLQLPTNRCGLPSDVIFDLLADLSDALKYLNRKNIVSWKALSRLIELSDVAFTFKNSVNGLILGIPCSV